VFLGDGLEEIQRFAFRECTSLHEIVIPSAVKVIKSLALFQYMLLTAVQLGEGLEEIGEFAFRECTSLHVILIPPAVKVIEDGAYIGCLQLTAVNLDEGLKWGRGIRWVHFST
jgi:hypothetical protein